MVPKNFLNMNKLKILLSFLFLTLILTSCLNYTQVTTIKTDGSGELFVHYWMSWDSKEDSIWLNKLYIFNPDSVKKQFESANNEINRVDTFINYEDSTIHTQVELEFVNFDSLLSTAAFKGSYFQLVDGPDGTKIISQFMAPVFIGIGINPKEYSYKIVYYLPGEILKHNADSKDSNKLTWEYTLDEIGKGKNLTATFRPYKLKETPSWVYISTLFVIIVVIFFLFRRRK